MNFVMIALAFVVVAFYLFIAAVAISTYSLLSNVAKKGVIVRIIENAFGSFYFSFFYQFSLFNYIFELNDGRKWH